MVEKLILNTEQDKDLELTDDMKLKILNAWNDAPKDKPPSVLDLVQLASGRTDLDVRSKFGRKVKEYLASRDIKPRKSYQYQPKGLLELTEEHKEYISNHCGRMTALEIGKELFNVTNNLSQEVRTINSYIDELKLSGKIIYEESHSIVKEEYKPPVTVVQAIARINKYVANSGLDKENNLNPKQRREVISFLGYIRNFRFLHQIGQYEKENDRSLFEDSFIKHTYNKDDLTQEDVDQYIILATEVVISHSILARIEKLRKLLDEVTESDEEHKRFSMGLIEAINGAQKEYNDSVNRQSNLYKNLTSKRSDRLKTQISANASLLQLIEFWQDEQKRKQTIHLADVKKEKLKEEVERLKNMDHLKFQIWGVDPTEVINS